jgi:hypothetical protein
MENRTTAIILTIVAVLLCGCPGLGMCIAGVVTLIGKMPYTTNVNGYSTSGTAPSWLGFVGLCVALFLIAIPIVVGILTLRKKKPAAEVVSTTPPSEPLPPAS